MLRLISADERLAERRGAKVLLLGPVGIGKTWQLRTLKSLTTLFIDIEAGDLAVLDLPVPTIRIVDWPTARDLACKIGGPNPSFPPTACYSPAHFEAAGGYLESLDQIETIFVDSLTALTRLAFRWAEQQPEAYTDRGKKDLRGIYGGLGREMVLFLNQLQHARGKNIIFVGILSSPKTNSARAAIGSCNPRATSARAAGHHRRNHHLSGARFWRRQAADAGLCLHQSKSLELSRKGSQRPFGSDRAARSRQAPHQAH